jgi:hypothetical protein
VVLTWGALLTEELLEDSEAWLLTEDSLDDELLAGSDEDTLEATEDEIAELTGGLLEEPPPPPQPVSIRAAEATVIAVFNNVVLKLWNVFINPRSIIMLFSYWNG